MVKETGIILQEQDQQDAVGIFTSLETAMNYFINVYPALNDLSEVQLNDYFKASTECLYEAKINEMLWRKHITKTYNVPFNFIYRNGQIFILETEEN